MNDPSTPQSSTDASAAHAADLAGLRRRVVRMIDADLLLAEEGGALLGEIAAAARARDAGDPAALRCHLLGFLRALEALGRSREIDTEDAGAALAAARRLLHHLRG